MATRTKKQGRPDLGRLVKIEWHESHPAVLPSSQKEGPLAAMMVVEESVKKVEEKAVKLGMVAKDIASAMATTMEEKTAL